LLGLGQDEKIINVNDNVVPMKGTVALDEG
jgi:hypothetical protein